MRRAACIVVALMALVARGGDLPTCAGPAFGTTYRVTLAREVPGRPLGAVHREIEAVVARIDRAASTWRDDSDAARFNQAPVGAWVEVADDLVVLVEVGRRVHEASERAFDVTVTADGDAAPGMTAIESRHSPPALRKTRAGVALDLGGIGPGYAVDAIGARLVELGSTDHVVELGGEVRAWGRRPDGQAWRISVGSVAGNPVELAAGAALGTSTARPGLSPVDPRSGRVVACRFPSATVRAPSCTEADAWAVAALVLGLQPDSQGLVTLTKAHHVTVQPQSEPSTPADPPAATPGAP